MPAPAPRFVRFARALALGGALAARLHGCAGYECHCPGPDGGLTQVVGACSAEQGDSGCTTRGVPGGPLPPPS